MLAQTEFVAGAPPGEVLKLLRLLRLIADRLRARAALKYWRRRAQRHGERSVLHLGHSADEVGQVTTWQKNILFPLLTEQLRGDERVILDFGCGPGRFTADLAGLVHGHAIGVDPIQALLDLAPPHPAVEYHSLQSARIPLADASVDVVWVCLVLGVITNATDLRKTIDELVRVLRPGGLLFLVENTADKPPARHIHYRSVEEYRALFPRAVLHHVSDYDDLGEPVSVLAGRKADR